MKRLLSTFALVFAVLGIAMAQRSVTGTVTGDDGEALIGASVAIKGTTGGARTDANGKYTVNVPAGSSVLVFSYTGYNTQEVT
ncbi:MAG: carboxypeptidase-like regulatory domain-containing protein, partial [Bacteroidota bacterium]